MLLNIYNHHDIETHFIFDIFMLYLCDLFRVVSLIFIAINHITSFEQTYLVFVHYLEYLLLFVDDNVGERSE